MARDLILFVLGKLQLLGDTMKKMKKFLRLQNIELTATQQHPKDISRAHLKVIDIDNDNQSYKTFHYGVVQPTKIKWISQIEMPFLAQKSLRFQTLCEHQYAYELQQLKALYNGIIYLKPDQFFFENTTHCFNQDGKQCGVLKYMIKIVEREEDKKKQQIFQTQEPVKVNLVAKVSIYAAAVVPHVHHTTSFHKKKRRNLKMEIRFGSSVFLGQPKFGQLQYKWLFASKFDVNENSPEIISITINEDDHSFLSGLLHLATLQQNKRFTVQIVPLMDQSNKQIGALHLDLRYISKKQLLDLMYSPQQLSDNKNREQEKHFHSKDRSTSLAGIPKLPKRMSNLQHSRALSKDILLNHSKISPSHRYKVRLFNDIHQASIPRSKRFPDPRDVNANISYLDPTLLSDFSPRSKRGATQTSSSKTDFTKPSKLNPGVGEYHLPSIWQKK